MSRPSIAEAEPTPTPAPASEVRGGVDTDLISRFAHCRSIEELPPELRDNPLIRAIVNMTPEEEARDIAANAARSEAYALYGDDPERILAAIEAGTHPLQRLSPTRE